VRATSGEAASTFPSFQARQPSIDMIRRRDTTFNPVLLRMRPRQ